MITSLSTQGGRINPQTMGASGPSPIAGLWSRGTPPVIVFNPQWALNSNTYLGGVFPDTGPK